MPEPETRPRRRQTTRRPAATAHKPPARIEPGWIHRTAAGITLGALKSRAEQSGVELRVGALPKPDEPEVGEETREPVELLSRVFAHIGHRVPGVRSIERRLEGTEAKSGLLSDLAALGVHLFRMNEDTIERVATGLIKSAVNKGSSKAASDLADTHIPDGDIPEYRPTSHPAQQGQPMPEQETVILVPTQHTEGA